MEDRNEAMHILIVENESKMRDLLESALTCAGYNVLSISQTRSVSSVAGDWQPHLIILNWDLWRDREQHLRQVFRLRRKSSIFLLSRDTEESEILRGFDYGADDYIVMPFSKQELLARVRAHLRRRHAHSHDDILKIGKISLNVSSRRIFFGSTEAILSPIEYGIIHLFMTHPNQIFSKQELLKQFWGEKITDDVAISASIYRLKKKLKSHLCEHYIKTIYGAGYLFSTVESDIVSLPAKQTMSRQCGQRSGMDDGSGIP